MRRKGIAVIVLGWAAAPVIALAMPARCPAPRCYDDVCMAIGCTPGLTSVPGLVIAAATALIASLIGLALIRSADPEERPDLV